MPELSIARLNQDRLAEAYPLVRSAARVGRERWEAYARLLLADGGGILAVTGGDGQILGIAAFRPAANLRHGSSLQVELIVTFELTPRAQARRALCTALERVAQEEGCRSLIFVLAAAGLCDARPALRTSWERLGFEPDSMCLVRQVPVG
jgi:hypothetical protein